MVKHTSVTFSAASVAKGLVVLSKAVEKNFALKGEISRLWHHVSVLSKRLQLVTLERNNLQLALEDLSSCLPAMDTGLPSGDVVVEEVRLPDGTEEVADDRMENRPACEEVADARGVVTPTDEALVVVDVTQPQVAERGMDLADCHNRYKLDLVQFDQEGSIRVPPDSPKKIGDGDVRPLGSSGDQDAVLGGVIVAGGASRKAKNKKRKGKCKAKDLEMEAGSMVSVAADAGGFKLLQERVTRLSEIFDSEDFIRVKGKIFNLDYGNMDLERLRAFCLSCNQYGYWLVSSIV